MRDSHLTFGDCVSVANGIGEPGGGHLAVDRGFRFGKQRAAELRLLVAQDDAGAMRLGGERGRDAGRARPDDERIAMGVALRVGVRHPASVGARPRPAMARIFGS